LLLLLLLPLLPLLLQTEMEDAVFIWCAEGSTRSHSSSSSSRHDRRQQQQQHSMPAAAAGAAAPVFVLDCLLPVEDTAASLAWLDTAGLPPLLAVGYASGLLEMYSRDHRCDTCLTLYLFLSRILLLYYILFYIPAGDVQQGSQVQKLLSK
jgi:hypothetical protein